MRQAQLAPFTDELTKTQRGWTSLSGALEYPAVLVPSLSSPSKLSDSASCLEKRGLEGAGLEDPDCCPQPQELPGWPPARGVRLWRDLLGIEKNSLADVQVPN
jgi:hypothetical protein